MIPKIIHYFYDDVQIYKKSTNPTFRICYTSWKMNLPDYEFKLWHVEMPEFQDMLKQSRFLRICYKEKMWAFIADYVRHYALYNYGGVYIDTDVQVLKTFDAFLGAGLFCSIEGDIRNGMNIPETAVLGAEKHHSIIKKTLDLYNSEEIFKVDYLIDPIVFGKVLYEELGFSKIEYSSPEKEIAASKYYKQESITLNDIELYKSQQPYINKKSHVAVFPSEFFCPTYVAFKNLAITDKTVAIHWNSSSWWKDLKKIYKLQANRFNNPLKKFFYGNAIDISRIISCIVFKKSARKKFRSFLTNYLMK
ncbi:MAG: hypothetical protein J5934_07185 [Succinivibrio sp.]|nr:hypothetical protein [Succinivibrio sp.]